MKAIFTHISFMFKRCLNVSIQSLSFHGIKGQVSSKNANSYAPSPPSQPPANSAHEGQIKHNLQITDLIPCYLT